MAGRPTILNDAKDCDDSIAPAQATGLEDAWKRWHLRAESFLHYLANKKVIVRTRTAERPKGSSPTMRLTALGPVCRAPEPVQVRLLRRLGLRFAAMLRQDRSGGKLNANLTSRDAASLYRALGGDNRAQSTYEQAISLINQRVAAWARKAQDAKRQQWRDRFSQWSRAAMQATKQSLKPHLPPAFTAQAMKQEWEPLWNAEPIRDLTKWEDMAGSHNWIRAEQTDDWLPSQDDYAAVVAATTGGARIDGWASNEAKLILTLGEFLIDESYDLGIRTCGKHSSVDEAEVNDPKGYLNTMLWGWRVAGIPKAGSAASRPICVASVWLRCWH